MEKIFEFEFEFDMWVNKHNFRCYIKCDYKMDFNVKNSLTLVLGFNKQVYNETYNTIQRSKRAVILNYIK